MKEYKPFAIIDKRIEFSYFVKDKLGYVFGINIDNKKQYELHITKKGNKAKIFRIA